MNEDNNETVEKNDEEDLSSFLKTLDDTYEKKLQDLKEELADVFDIDQYSLVDENIKTVSRLHLWITRQAVEHRKLLNIKRKRDNIYSELYAGYREGKKGFITLTKDGIDAYINRDSTFQKWDSFYEEQKIIVEFIEQICWALKQTKMTALKNIQESKKLEGQ